ncbi:MAG TPA: LysM peptidoglycan-binding domain-containing protein [Gammaproteobacteria bacterium]|nr:LysM peptidoglycan-binding domain-containing protein [Gammaproteobacteria bacterium]
MADGKYDEAVKLANKARRQAENAVKQKYSELDRIGAGAATDSGSSDTGADSAAAAAGAGASQQYEVVRGDNLWDISAKPEIYDNPYQWPLIYKNNSDQIKDADLIYPGQVLDIDTNPSAADVDAAVAHARSRGSWSLGVVEESDKAYLAQ